MKNLLTWADFVLFLLGALYSLLVVVLRDLEKRSLWEVVTSSDFLIPAVFFFFAFVVWFAKTKLKTAVDREEHQAKAENRELEAREQKREMTKQLITELLTAMCVVCRQRRTTNTQGRANLDIRLCVFEVRDGGDFFDAVSPQIGDNNNELLNEPTSIRLGSGIVGHAFVTKKLQSAWLPKNAKLVPYLVENHRFDEKMAKTIRSDRKAWMGIPLKIGDSQPFGVLVLDSSNRGRFQDNKTAQPTEVAYFAEAFSLVVAKLLKDFRDLSDAAPAPIR